MSHKKQRGHMWGCWVVWTEDIAIRGMPQEQWVSGVSTHGYSLSCLRFTKTRKEVELLVSHMRGLSHVKSAKAVKVPIPEPPDA